ncbi:MAG: 2-phospho-L-lactate transferase CofD family protein, partial [Pseudomonadota bacterium]
MLLGVICPASLLFTMDYFDTKHGPTSLVQLSHPTLLPVYGKVERYGRHPMEGPPVLLLSGGNGARLLAKTLMQYTHNSVHVLPTFDDGGSSRELRKQFGMPPPGDLRNRLMALSDMTMRGNPEVGRLFQTRLPNEGTCEQLQEMLEGFLREDHPQMAKIESRYRRIIRKHLETFVQNKPKEFDLRGGSIGNFVITGAYLSVGDLESVIFEFSALAAVRGHVYPVCTGANYHLKAVFDNGKELIGQSSISTQDHPHICRL